MATRSSIPGTKAGATDSLSVAEFNDLPGGCIGYIVLTSNTTTITSAQIVATLTFTPPASRFLRFVGQVNMSASATSGDYQVTIAKDGTNIGRQDRPYTPLTSGDILGGMCVAVDISPTNASHTYTLLTGRGGTDGNTYTLNASATQPAFFLAFDDGPSF